MTKQDSEDRRIVTNTSGELPGPKGGLKAILNMALLARPYQRRPLFCNMAGNATQQDWKVDFQHPQFFISQSERLSALLDAVVAESATATDPDACIDYLELTEILVELLNQAQYFSVLSLDQVENRWKEVESLMSKTRTIRDAVADWETRTNVKTGPVAVDADTPIVASRKRARSMDSDMGSEDAYKRRREDEFEHKPEMGDGLDIVQESTSPPKDEPPTYWWTEPFYD